MVPFGSAIEMATAWAKCLSASLDAFTLRAFDAQVDEALAATPPAANTPLAERIRLATVQSASTCVGPTGDLYAGGGLERNSTTGAYQVVPADQTGCLAEQVCARRCCSSDWWICGADRQIW